MYFITANLSLKLKFNVQKKKIWKENIVHVEDLEQHTHKKSARRRAEWVGWRWSSRSSRSSAQSRWRVEMALIPRRLARTLTLMLPNVHYTHLIIREKSADASPSPSLTPGFLSSHCLLFSLNVFFSELGNRTYFLSEFKSEELPHEWTLNSMFSFVCAFLEFEVWCTNFQVM